MVRARLSRDPVVFEELTCAFCRGRGKDPFGIMSSFSTCCVCGGIGKVRVPAPIAPCAHCQGSGAIGTLTCTTCGGRGVVPRPAVPTVPCPLCHGTGDDASAPAMACLKCRGTGWINDQIRKEKEVHEQKCLKSS
jgi:DnaJ-class molecular chaperone